MKYDLLYSCLFALIGNGVYAQQSLTVRDSITNEVLPYASISLWNGFGLFTDENGQVLLDKDTPDTIKVSYMGYQTKTVVADKAVETVVLLQPELNVLKEVTIIQKRDVKKRRDFTIKPVLHDNIYKMYWSSIGQQYAFYIPATQENSILKSVTIPLIVKDLHQGLAVSSFETEPYGTMVKIEFMSNVGGLPTEMLYDHEKKVVIQSGKVTDQTTVAFDIPIDIPVEGIFVTMTIIGKTNAEGIYVPELPYAIMDLQDRQKKIKKIILPNYALVEAPKGQLTFFRNVFSDISTWERITRPMVYKEGKEHPMYNIGIGYTFSGY